MPMTEEETERLANLENRFAEMAMDFDTLAKTLLDALDRVTVGAEIACEAALCQMDDDRADTTAKALYEKASAISGHQVKPDDDKRFGEGKKARLDRLNASSKRLHDGIRKTTDAVRKGMVPAANRTVGKGK